MSTEMPTKVDAFCVKLSTGSHEVSHKSAKFDSADENVHESVLCHFSHVLFSHVLFLAQFLCNVPLDERSFACNTSSVF